MIPSNLKIPVSYDRNRLYIVDPPIADDYRILKGRILYYIGIPVFDAKLDTHVVLWRQRIQYSWPGPSNLWFTQVVEWPF
jgi:hypothetical protein